MLARGRLREVSPRRYAQLAAASALSLYLIVITGAAVRLTGSGLACESWPGCQEGAFFPAVGTHSAIEFGNRAFALFPIVLSLAAWIAAYRVPGLSRWAVWVAALVFLGTIGQAPLGLLTIRLDLHPLMVLTHFLLALVVLAGAVVLLSSRGATPPVGPTSPLSRSLRWLSLVLVVACGILVVTGTLSTASGPHPGDSADIDRFWNLLDAMWLHVRATAAFGISFLVLLVYLAAPVIASGACSTARSRCSGCCSCRWLSVRSSGATSCHGGSSSCTWAWRRRSGPGRSASWPRSGGRRRRFSKRR